MNPATKAKIKQFANDKPMNEAVYSVVSEKLFSTSKDRDVNVLAARFLAIEILNEAWKDMLRFKEGEENVSKEVNQIGM